jgi:hypothetical protein
VIEEVSMNPMHFMIFAIIMVFKDKAFVVKTPQQNGVAEHEKESIYYGYG